MQDEARGRRPLVTKSVRLEAQEAADLAAFARLIAESEASVLRRALLRGLAAERLHRALAAYLEGATSFEAAELAALPRAVFLEEAAQRGLRTVEDVGGLDDDLATLLADEGLVDHRGHPARAPGPRRAG